MTGRTGQRGVRLSLFGAAPDTGNLGVSALCYATLSQLAAFDPGLKCTVFAHSSGWITIPTREGKGHLKFRLRKAVNSRRVYRADNLRFMRLAGRFGGLGNPGIAEIRSSDAIMDISGGDSFTDIYGRRRFDTVTLPKMLALEQKRPLILLPQTYGPFTSPQLREKAAAIVRRAQCCWARDQRSFAVLKELLGPSFDPVRHRCGVDVAFGLPRIKPDKISPDLQKLLTSRSPRVGINVSGLIYNTFARAKKQFAFRADYPAAIRDLVRRFLERTECRIVLVPHVVTPRGHFESDLDACRDVAHSIAGQAKGRIVVMPAHENPCAVKWVISRLDWFCGTRIHAAIAALSTGVPVAAVSYSLKTIGVFESCGQGAHVADPQVLDRDELVEALWQSWKNRTEARMVYETRLPEVMAILEEQMEHLLSCCRSRQRTGETGRRQAG